MFRRVIKGLIILLAVIFIFQNLFNILGIEISPEDMIEKDVIATIDFSGQILESDKFIAKMEKLVKSEKVKGIIVKVNSPGGAITPSFNIYNYIMTIEKPVYIAMDSVAASGGYLIALGADKIYAMPTTITGSIGVIMSLVNMEELFDKIGIKSVVLKSGKFKDIGNPDKTMTEEETALMMEVINDMYEQFVNAVASRRNLQVSEVKEIADGRIFTGNMAEKLKLIDNLGSYSDAFVDMKIALENDKLELYEYKEKKKFIDKLIEGTGINKLIETNSDAGFYYLMK